MSKRLIEVVEYNPHWPQLYEQEVALIAAALGDTLLKAHHIGSTAVPGLAAKPVIDIILVVSCLSQLDDKAPLLEPLGYTAKGENGIPGRRYFQKGGNQRSHHIHAFLPDDPHIQRHLAFRDYLKAHPSVAGEYAEVKRQAAKACAHDSALYGELKSEFIERIETLCVA